MSNPGFRRAGRSARTGQYIRPAVNPDDPHVQRACLGKRKLNNRKQAAHAACGAAKNAGERMDYYKCPFCGFWHICRLSNSFRKKP